MTDTPINEIDLKDKLFSYQREALADLLISLEDQTISHTLLIELAQQEENENIKAWALLKLKDVYNQQEADVIIKLLHHKDSRIRELSSDIIYYHSEKNAPPENLFNNNAYFETYIHTMSDVNPRVTRNISLILSSLDNKDALFGRIQSRRKSLEGPYEDAWFLEFTHQLWPHLSTEKQNIYLDPLMSHFAKILIGQDAMLKERVAVILKDLLPQISLETFPQIKGKVQKLLEDDSFYIKKITDTYNLSV